MRLLKLAIALGSSLVVAAASHAVSFGFQNITNTTNSIGPGQLMVDVNPGPGGTVSFLFTNLGPIASSITDVYFDDGTLLGIATINNGAGVNYSAGASPPNLPGGNLLAVPFVTTAGFSADSNPPAQPNGVNPGEQLEILFNLLSGQTFADTIAALQQGLTNPAAPGSLRIGIHVQAIGPTGDSDSFVNVPEPNVALLAMVAFGCVGGALRIRSED
jgi:hypothetical protein